ncbi:DUF5134 domain-containing protein [Streptomyces sp. NBC_00859]|uniref:DUF5134 domain-containing protein n=1 Tax=Streptomyces sp. NBC_00859 TaxID=2903682 RepID=UPI003870A30D|nr:DUF5134 domain-containing protein [Streptomyces sp. NBC_00859]
MHGSAMSGWLLVALGSATGAYCLLRMRSTSQQARKAAGSEAVMGFGMAAMALPAAVVVPPAWGWTVLAAVFAAGGLRALWQARTSARHLHHLVGSLAMVYMALTMGPGMSRDGAHGGAMDHAEHSAGGVPLVTGALLAYYAVYVLRAGATLAPAPAAVAGGGMAGGASGGPIGWGSRPELALACRLAMGIAMFAMLLTL